MAMPEMPQAPITRNQHDHHRPEHAADGRRAEPLGREEDDDDRHGDRHDQVIERRLYDL